MFCLKPNRINTSSLLSPESCLTFGVFGITISRNPFLVTNEFIESKKYTIILKIPSIEKKVDGF